MDEEVTTGLIYTETEIRLTTKGTHKLQDLESRDLEHEYSMITTIRPEHRYKFYANLKIAAIATPARSD
jgi:hypothetical protein